MAFGGLIEDDIYERIGELEYENKRLKFILAAIIVTFVLVYFLK